MTLAIIVYNIGSLVGFVLVSIVEFMDILLQKRRSVIAAIAFSITLLLISILAPILQAHHGNITAYIQSSGNDQGVQTYDNPNVVTNALSQMANYTGHAAGTAELRVLNGALSLAGAITDFDRAVEKGAYNTTSFAAHSVSASVRATTHVIGDGLTFTGHMKDNTIGFLSGVTRVSSLIRPPDRTPTPTITQMRAQQAIIIQSGTKNVSIPAMSAGIGGACDDGEGNGGYPLAWCNASMDSLTTISYTSEPINRECTSYAYWYFTAIEGQTGFHASGNAKYWATTSNYPTHTTPAVGAIAVETVGAYGHVAIVEGLPGQDYEGQEVPAGYVLVSEMNYDWQGHFRYSYSPLGKFTAYIYP